MSMNETDTLGVDIEPMPDVTSQQSKYSLGPDFQFTERPVTQG